MVHGSSAVRLCCQGLCRGSTLLLASFFVPVLYWGIVTHQPELDGLRQILWIDGDFGQALP